MRVLLARDEAEVTRFGDPEAAVLWLGPGQVPAALDARAVKLEPDPPLIEGWLAIRRLGDATVNGRSVKQAVEYDGVSLWWFAHYWLVYGDGLAGWDEIYRVLRRLQAGLAAGADEIVLLSRRADDDMVARAVSATKGIAYRWAAPWLSRFKARLLLRWRSELLIRLRMTKLIVRGFVARRMRKNSVAGRAPVDILFNTSSGSWNARLGKDRVLDPLLVEAGRQGLSVAGLHLDYRRNLGIDSLRALDPRIVAWESLVTPRLAMMAIGRGREIAAGFGGAFPGEVLGVPASRLLEDRLPVLFGARLADAVLAIETSRIAMWKLRPKCLYVVDAYDLWGRALVVAAREEHLPSIEIQHGIILDNHGGYLHLEGEVAPDRRQRSQFTPIPDLIAVHGEQAKESLVRSGRFPSDSIHITGSPIIEAARKRQGDRAQIRARLGVRDDQVAALFFGVPPHIFPADDLHLRSFLAACRQLPGFLPLLRPHPIDHSNPGRYRAAARAAGIDAAVLTDGDPLELVLASDIVVSHNSTTALDAMALHRPVIHVNMSGSPDLFPFVEEGGAIAATTPDGLEAALSSLREGDARQAQAERQEPYANRTFAPCPDPARAMLSVGFPEVTRA